MSQANGIELIVTNTGSSAEWVTLRKGAVYVLMADSAQRYQELVVTQNINAYVHPLHELRVHVFCCQRSRSCPRGTVFEATSKFIHDVPSNQGQMWARHDSHFREDQRRRTQQNMEYFAHHQSDNFVRSNVGGEQLAGLLALGAVVCLIVMLVWWCYAREQVHSVTEAPIRAAATTVTDNVYVPAQHMADVMASFSRSSPLTQGMW
jgi:hypothetical protein